MRALALTTLALVVVSIQLCGCSGARATSEVVARPGFLGAFFRPVGAVPFGVFSPRSPNVAPQPYPEPSASRDGPAGYCRATAPNGVSIEGAYVVDTAKLSNITSLGVGWTRMTVSQFLDDGTHLFGPGHYSFGALDSAQCKSLVDHGIRPVIGLEAGPVQYNATPGGFTSQTLPLYRNAADFGGWCGAVAAHERKAFPAVTQFSLPGNEVNTNTELFPGGPPQIAAYAKACYAAIKAANPHAFVYGFELNMDGHANAPDFVRQLYELGCKAGTCYDGIAIHLSLKYPLPPLSAPCYPHAGGTYGMQCVADIRSAANAPVHILISETVYAVPGSVPDEATKAQAVDAEFETFAADPAIDGAAYGNIDECAIYPSGYFAGGCLVDKEGKRLPAFGALQALTAKYFR
jgi:hypothetical protein